MPRVAPGECAERAGPTQVHEGAGLLRERRLGRARLRRPRALAVATHGLTSPGPPRRRLGPAARRDVPRSAPRRWPAAPRGCAPSARGARGPRRRAPPVLRLPRREPARRDRKSTRLNSSHITISYAVFCLKKKKQTPFQSRITKKKNKITR